MMKAERRLCDDKGMVSHELVGDPIFPELTFIKQIENLRRHTPMACDDHGNLLETYNEPYPCTGSAHLAGMEICCTSPAHNKPPQYAVPSGRTLLALIQDPKGYPTTGLMTNEHQPMLISVVPTDDVHDLRERVENLERILKGFVEGEDGPCRFDHHGYCQEHGWFGEPGECYTREARELLGL